MNLRKSLIKLASDNPELRKHLVPLLKEAAELEIPHGVNPDAWQRSEGAVLESLSLLERVDRTPKVDPRNAFYEYVTLDYRGHRIPLTLNFVAQPDRVKSFIALLPKMVDYVEDMVKSYPAGTDRTIFYSNVHRGVSRFLGSAKGGDMAEQVIYLMLADKGFKLEGD